MTSGPIDRRMFFKWSAASLSALGLCGMPPFLRRTLAAPLLSGKKLMFIFLRGGIDGVQTVIPYGDAGIPGEGKKTYLQARPTLGIAPSEAYDLNGFASLHPAMQSSAGDGPHLGSIFHGTEDERGPNLAVLSRIGYESQNRSHFSSQQFWENAIPGNVALEQGFLNRYVTAYPDATSPLQAATLNSNQVVMMKGDTLIPVLRSINDYALPGNVNLGTPPAPPGDPTGTGLSGAYGQAGFDPTQHYNPLTYGTGSTLFESLQFFEDNVRNVPYSPEANAQTFYNAMTDNGFRNFVRDSARLLKQVDSLQIVGCNQGGYDTHGDENNRIPSLVGNLGLALTALYHDLKPIWDDTIVVTMSEFGRTSEENGNRGTDHGESTVMFCMGGPVVGDVYNADPSRWANGDLFSTANGRYVAHRTDFRQIYAQLITQHLGDPSSKIDEVIPNYSGVSAPAQDPNGYFDPLGFIV